MDMTKSHTKYIIEEQLKGLNWCKLFEPENSMFRYKTLVGLFTQMHYDMKKQKGGDEMVERHLKFKRAVAQEMEKHNRGMRNTKFDLLADQWERELLAFYREEYKETEFMPEMA